MLKAYVGTKVILAEPMTLGEYNTHRGWQIPADEDPSRPGYLIVYPDSYQSWSPKETFEDAYEPEEKLSFSAALYLLKKGHRIARAGWNGRGQYIVRITGEQLARSAGYGFGEALGEFTFGDVFCLKNAQNIMQPGWVPSMGDMLANDWMIYK